MPYWIRDIEGRLVKIETPQETELEVCLNIMDVPPEDQNSQHGQEDNFNAYRSMRDACIHLAKEYPTWTDLQAEFLKKFFPTHRTNGLKRQILNFSAKENEKFYECWERYMEAINACPHHGFDTWLLVSYFYDVSRGWDEPNAREVGRMKSQPNAKGGMYVLNEDIDMKAKVAAMARRLEELEMKKVQEVQAISETPVQAMPCSICQSYEHLVEECPTIPVVREMFGDQANVIGQFKPNNNASYGKPTIQIGGTIQISLGNQSHLSINAQLNQRIDSVESTLNKMMDGMQNDLSQKIDNVQYAISRLTNLNTVQEKGKFPFNLIKIPRVSMKWRLKRENLQRTREDSHQGRYDEETHASTFPQALHGKKGTNNASEIFEVLRQVKVNIPLLDMIKQVSICKILEGLVHCKERVECEKKAFLTEQIVPSYIKQSSIVGMESCNSLWQHDIELNIFHLYKKHIHPEEEEGLLTLDLLATLLPGGGEKKFYPYSMRRDKELLRRSPKLILKPLPTS
ncbi:hypothetical protein CK203_061628 [Vitis vinifera]|uniref:Retrotransposon gag domain-containing protein n=1 Tax=Vitis vinifera TaxID=29760 RepID=A0A438FQI7_VITVI|nr:hypothetical protein CK203_061628 [Vitis vinifera]